MQAYIITKADDSWTGKSYYFDVTLTIYGGDVAIRPDDSTNWAALVAAIESNGSYGSNRSSAGEFSYNSGIVLVRSPWKGEGAAITVRVPGADCLAAFRQVRDARAEFDRDPAAFAAQQEKTTSGSG